MADESPSANRRTPEGAPVRELWRHIDTKFGAHKEEWDARLNEIDTEFKMVRLEIKSLDSSKLSSSAVIAIVVALCLAASGGVVTFTAGLSSKIDARFEKWEQAKEKTDAQLQRLEISAAKSDATWSVIGEKQKVEIVKRRIQEVERELAPPPEPINPLAPTKGRR